MPRKTVLQFLNDFPSAIPFHKKLGEAIAQKKIPLTGSSYDVAKRAYDWVRPGWERSIDSFFEEQDRLAAEKERKRNASKP